MERRHEEDSCGTTFSKWGRLWGPYPRSIMIIMHACTCSMYLFFLFNRGVCKSQDRVITGHPSDLISIDVLTQPYVTHPYNGPNPWGIEDLSVCLYDVDERADSRYYNGGSTDFL